MKDPLLAPAAALIAGILLSREVEFGVLELWLEAAAFAALALLARRRNRAAAYAAALLCVMAVGTLVDLLHRSARAPSIDASSRETVLLSGCVVEPDIFYEGRDQFTLELAPKARARVTLALSDGDAPPGLSYGQRVEVEARVRPIRNFANPGSFDFVTYSARRHIYWTASARGTAAVKALPGRCGSVFLRGIFALRTAALQRIDTLYKDNPYATGMMQAILIGESTKLEKIWTEHFRRTGTFHAIVISGLHVTVLAATLLFLMRVCFVGELWALSITAAVAWLYAMVTGWGAPIIRASGGLTLYLAGRYFYRERRMMNLLAAVAILYLLYDPGQLFEASFQLSFLSVAVLAVLALPLIDKTSTPYRRALPDLAETSRDLHLEPVAAQFRVELRLLAETISCYVRLPGRWILAALGFSLRLLFYAYEMAVISTVIQIGVALPMAIYFHRISFSGFSANLIIVPLLTVVVPVGFFAIFTGLPAAVHLASWLLAASEKVAAWHVRWEPDRRIPDPPLWLSLAFVAALVALAFTMNGRRAFRWTAAAAIAILFALVFLHPFPPATKPGSLELSAIDVGQGDSLLVAFPDGKLMLVDGGGILAYGRKIKPRLDIGEDVVSPYLWHRSIRKVDIVVATHMHEDHTGGMGALIDNFHPAALWTGINGESAIWSELSGQARRRDVGIVSLHAGERFPFGGANIEVVSPPADYVPGTTPKNNDSLAFRVTYGEHSFLLTGDIEKQMEARLLADERDVRAIVLKACHHGSKTSSTEPFLDAVHPAFAIISSGYENSFGHPHPEVLARLSRHHAGILRTDLRGLVTIETDGRHLSVGTAHR